MFGEVPAGFEGRLIVSLIVGRLDGSYCAEGKVKV
jgi:hypothetical protein